MALNIDSKTMPLGIPAALTLQTFQGASKSALEAIQMGAGITGTASLDGVSIIPLVHPEVSSKTEGLWTCQSRESDAASGGFSYTLRLNDEYDDITDHEDRNARFNEGFERQKQLFPAAQNQGFHVLYLDPENKQKFIESAGRYFMREKYPEVKPETCEYNQLLSEIMDVDVLPFVEHRLRHVEIFRRLGYGCESREDGVYLKLPDRTMLLDRWNKLCAERPELPPLDIASMDSPVNSKTFLSFYLQKDVLLESRAEFFHDHVVHVMAALRLALDSGTFVEDGVKITYEVQKKMTRAYIQEIYKGLQPYRDELSQLKKAILAGKNLSSAEIKELKLYYNKMLNLSQLTVVLLSAVADTLASYDTYEKVMNHLHMPMSEIFIDLLQNEQWNAYLSREFTPEEIEAAFTILLNSLQN